MIEQKMRSALLLLAGSLLAAGAWGQTVVLTQSVDKRLVVASELFGAPGRLVVAGDNSVEGSSQAQVKILISPAESGNAASLDQGNKADITFTLRGATFAGAVTPGALTLVDGGATSSGRISSAVSDGNRGDRSVTFELEVLETVTATVATDTEDEYLLFNVPSLLVDPVVVKAADTTATPPVPAQMGVSVVATIKQVRNANNSFPSTVTSAMGSTARVPIVPEDSRIIRLASALDVGLGAGGAENVLLSNLKAFEAGTLVTMAGGEEVRGLTVGTLNVDLVQSGSGGTDAEPFEEAGETWLRVLRSGARTTTQGTGDAADLLNSELGGDLIIRVQGPFKEGDQMVLGENQGAADAKAFTIDGTVATATVQIASIANMAAVYIPGGVEDLRPAKFRASLELDFNREGARSGPVQGVSSEGEIKYKGIETKAYAYGVSRADDQEVTSFLRLTCTNPTPPAAGCNIFINCTDESGTSHFGELTTTKIVPSGGTGVYTSGNIAEALNGGGWEEGSGSCNLMSTGDLQVQHMIRTSGNALHNNSVVIGMASSTVSILSPSL